MINDRSFNVSTAGPSFPLLPHISREQEVILEEKKHTKFPVSVHSLFRQCSILFINFEMKTQINEGTKKKQFS